MSSISFFEPAKAGWICLNIEVERENLTHIYLKTLDIRQLKGDTPMYSFNKVDIKGLPFNDLPQKAVKDLESNAAMCRSMILKMTTVAGSGHPAGSLSSLEMFLVTYGAADLTPENCNSTDRDFVVISHGHVSPAAYSVLSSFGFFDPDEVVAHFRQAGSPYQGHVEREVPGIDWGSGNLGQGLSAGVGYALGQRALDRKRKVFVLGSDGEQTKGQIAEARRMAVSLGLKNLTVLIDRNHIQISGRTEDVMHADVPSLWKADGWEVMECDGHSVKEIYSCLKRASKIEKPAVIICNTTMGKGVSFMENVPAYHGKAASGEKYQQADKELGSYGKSLEWYVDKRKNSLLPSGRKLKLPHVQLETGRPRNYTLDDNTDNRSAFGNALEDIGTLNYGKKGKTPLLVFDCDLSGSVKTSGFAKACPEWFIQAGIQEHSVATASGAASLSGVVPVWADFGVFGISEVYNQQRLNDINRTSLKLFLTHVGLDVGEDGMTHQCIDYVSLMRNMFGWRIVVPADPNQTDRIVRWMMKEPGNICMAMGRSKVPVITDSEGDPSFNRDYTFEYGKYDLLRSGNDGAILAMGRMVPRALKAWNFLKEMGINTSIYNVSCPLDIDREVLEKIASGSFILTLEDHHAGSGMGSIVSSWLGQNDHSCKMRICGVKAYGQSGRSEEVLDNMGLSESAIVDQVKELLD